MSSNFSRALSALLALAAGMEKEKSPPAGVGLDNERPDMREGEREAWLTPIEIAGVAGYRCVLTSAAEGARYDMEAAITPGVLKAAAPDRYESEP